MIIFSKDYRGFESLSDIDRDISEAFDSDFNPKMKGISGEFQGTIKVLIEYEPAPEEL